MVGRITRVREKKMLGEYIFFNTVSEFRTRGSGVMDLDDPVHNVDKFWESKGTDDVIV